MKCLFIRTVSFVLFFILSICQYSLQAQDSLLVNNLEKHVSYLASDSLEGRGLGTEGAKQAKNYIENEFDKVGLVPFKGDFIHPFTFKCDLAQVAANNIIGMIEGADPVLKNEYIVLGAHYDHLGWYDDDGERITYNGADDNASGVAGIIELARMFKEQNTEIKRSILFIAFDAEESGLYGSANLIEDSILTASEIKCMFSIDMIGMYSKNEGLELNGFETLIGANDLVDLVLKEKTIKIKKVSKKIELRTDTAPFARQGIPSAHVFTGSKSPYHKPEDDADLLDYNGMADVVEFMFVLAQKIANNDELVPTAKLLAFQKEQEDGPAKISFGVRLNTGSSYHNYTEEYFQAKSVFATEAGFTVNLRLSEFISVQPELLYAMGGSQSEKGVIKTHALSVPIHVIIGSSDLNYGRFYAFGGPFLNYNFAGNIDGETIVFNDDYTQQTIGVSYGFGLEIGKIQMGLILNRGLTDIGNRITEGKTYENGIRFSMGYRF